MEFGKFTGQNSEAGVGVGMEGWRELGKGGRTAGMVEKTKGYNYGKAEALL